MKKATLQIDGSWKIEDLTSEEETNYNADVASSKTLFEYIEETEYRPKITTTNTKAVELPAEFKPLWKLDKLSPEYRKFYENNQLYQLYCLTATAPEYDVYRKYLKSIAPIVRTTDINKALSLGLVSPYLVYNLAVEFTPQEMVDYNKAN